MNTVLLPYLFDHNWASAIQLDLGFTVSISNNVDSTEQRFCHHSKTTKTISISGFTLAKDDAVRLQESLATATKNKVLFPSLYDEAKLTASLSIGSVFIPFDTASGRFITGDQIIIIEWDRTTKKAKVVHNATILSVVPTGVNVAAIPVAFSANSYVYPLSPHECSLTINASLSTDQLVSFSLTLIEDAGALALRNYTNVGTNPAGFSTWKSLPILATPNNWDIAPKWNTIQKGQKAELGLGTTTTLLGPTKNEFIVPYTRLTKSQAISLIRFFESRAGSTYPFFYPFPVDLFTVTQIVSSTVIKIKKTASQQALIDAKLLSFWLNDGTCIIRGISGISDLGQEYQITLNESVSFTITDLARMSYAMLARFNIDSMSVEWKTTGTTQQELTILSLPLSSLDCVGSACEGGNCEGDDCPDPGDIKNIDPILPPWEPGDPCPPKVFEVPMYYDVTQFWNSRRDIVRAADLGLPPEMTIDIKKGFVADPLHPSGGNLSTELKQILYGPHLLAYQGLINRSNKSRNPYHVGRNLSVTNRSVRSGGELVEDSPYWQKTVNYTVSGTPHTVTFRIYAEFVDHTTPSDYGAWGTIFVLFVYGSEIANYTDGTPYAPFGGLSFTLDDPLVYDIYSGGSGYVRYCHPKTILMAVLATSLHSPIGYEYYKPLSREKLRVSCHKVPNVTIFAPSLSASAVNNAVFGLPNTVLRGLASFGGWTKSEFFPWLCSENETGSGKTALKPTNPGWAIVDGSPTLTVGLNDLSITVCACPDTDEINPCNGLPDEPCPEYGGTPDCYRNETPVGDPDFLCFSTSKPAVIVATEACASEKKLHSEDCSISRSCSVSYVDNVFILPLEDFELASTYSRVITWRNYYDDPDYVRLHFPDSNFCSNPTEDWYNEYGSATLAAADCPTNPKANITSTGFAGGTIKLMHLYETGIQDGVVSAELPYAANSIAGVGYRLAGTFNIERGYLAVLARQTSKIRLYKFTAADTISLIAEKDLSGLFGNDTLAISASFSGSIHTIRLLTAAQTEIGSLIVDDCSHDEEANVAVVTLSAIAQVFNNFRVQDNNWVKLEATASVFGKDTITSFVPPELLKLQYMGTCDTSISCDPCTSCLEITDTIHNVNEAGSADYPDGPVKPKNSTHDPVAVNGECGIVSTPPACGDCPPPYKAFDLTFPPGCSNIKSTSIWDGGLEYFFWSVGAVP